MAPNQNKVPMRAVVLLAAVILVASVSSGCINASWTKGFLNPEKAKYDFETKQKVVQKHFFNTVLSDTTSIERHMSNMTQIKDGTLWISTTVKVTMDPVPITFPIQLPSQIQRYVHIVITMPDGTAWYERTFNVTGNESVDIQSPQAGEWVFQVDAVGYGLDAVSYHDGFSIIASAYEPVKV